MPPGRASSLALSGEVSLSFRDEVSATLRGAMEVAVEIAVLEICGLVSQALRDVRDQMHESVRENELLKTRLQAAEDELDAARKSAGRTTASENEASDSGGGFNAQSQSLEYERNCERPDESFREIAADGRVHAQELTPAAASSSGTVCLRFIKLGSDPLRKSLQSEKQQKVENGQSMEDETLKEEPVQVKEENVEPDLGDESGAEGDIGSGCNFNPGSDEFGPDRLSLVQSKLLEDWRPDPEQPEEESTESADPGPSQCLESSSTGSRTAFSASFDELYPSVDQSHIGQAAPQNYGVQIRTVFHPSLHLCKICGHSFSRPSDLRRHHSQRHRVRTSNSGKTSMTGKPAKQQMFPPGCSPYHCNECGRDFNRMENLKTHLRIHTGERPYSCSVCGVRFRHSGALTRHFRIHTGEKPYVCGQCGKRFRNCGGLRFHQKSHSRERQ